MRRNMKSKKRNGAIIIDRCKKDWMIVGAVHE